MFMKNNILLVDQLQLLYDKINYFLLVAKVILYMIGKINT